MTRQGGRILSRLFSSSVFSPSMLPLSRPYVGRFAPSPTGPLHLGSLVAAMASFLDARVHQGRWIVRMEDVDETRTAPGAAAGILKCLSELGLQWDGPVMVQSERTKAYEDALDELIAAGLAYPCACSRKELSDSVIGRASDGAPLYPGTCRDGLASGRAGRLWRMKVGQATIGFTDRECSYIVQQLDKQVGDFVVRRGDGLFAYQLAVVVDDGEQGITHIVRGEDLLDSTPRQILLQRALSLPTPIYLHVPVVRQADGDKLSKQTGAKAIDLARPIEELTKAAACLGMEVGPCESIDEFWERAKEQWIIRLARVAAANQAKAGDAKASEAATEGKE